MTNINETALQLEGKSLDLALIALNELARRKTDQTITYSELDATNFCKSIIDRDDQAQINLIETLILRGISLEIIYEIFIPEAAKTLGNLWNESKLSFVEVNIGAQRLQRLSRIYEKRYLGPMYLFPEGPEILLILPPKEVHTLGLITAAGIFKKHWTNPFVAVGYTDEEIIELIRLHNFKLIGLSVSNSDNIKHCLKTARNIKSVLSKKIPMVIGGQGIKKSNNSSFMHVFDKTTTNPLEALELITD